MNDSITEPGDVFGLVAGSGGTTASLIQFHVRGLWGAAKAPVRAELN
jgi:hypothetical protein